MHNDIVCMSKRERGSTKKYIIMNIKCVWLCMHVCTESDSGDVFNTQMKSISIISINSQRVQKL